jgi:Smg protein
VFIVFRKRPSVSSVSSVSSEPVMTFRVPGPHERGRFAPEAWGHLLALRGSGVLSASDFEHVIDRVLGQIEGRVALEDVRALLDGVGLGDDSGGQPASIH